LSFLISIGTANPGNAIPQGEIADFIIWLNRVPENEAQRLKQLFSRTAIKTRYSVIPDFRPGNNYRFFTQQSNPSLESRMALFGTFALALAKEAALKALANLQPETQITHLITVTCTGLSAPGLEIALLQELNLPLDTCRTAVNFIGCYAAFHALKIADAFCNTQPNARVLVVCVELCSIHFQPGTEKDNLLANALFADGAAAAIISAKPEGKQALRIAGFKSLLNPKGKADMAWQISSQGFLMTLSSYIPELLTDGIAQITHSLLQCLDIKTPDVNHWALHPGGRKILEVFGQVMNIEAQQLQASYNTLANFGNMSAPTILFVLQNLIEHHIDWQSRQITMAMGFGPGLTLESMVLENVTQ
jgi:alpha-pyrone synthase